MTDIALGDIANFITPKGVDTLILSKLLRQLNFSEAQAEFVSEVIKQTNENSEKIAEKAIAMNDERNLRTIDNLATKHDILLLKSNITELRTEIEKSKSDLTIKIERMGSNLIKWVTGLIIANTGLFFALIKIFNN